MVAYAAVVVSAGRVAAPPPSRRSARIKIEADTKRVARRAAGELRQHADHGGELPEPAERASLQETVGEITKAIPEDERIIGLDRVLAFVDKSTIMPKDVPGLKADPPPIFFSQTPAVLVNFDGEPIWSPIAKNDLKFAVNTNWDVFQHEPDQDVLPALQRRAG